MLNVRMTDGMIWTTHAFVVNGKCIFITVSQMRRFALVLRHPSQFACLRAGLWVIQVLVRA